MHHVNRIRISRILRYDGVHAEHCRLASSATGSAKPLPQCRYRPRCTDLSHAVDITNVDPEFKGRCAYHRDRQASLLQPLLNMIPVITGQVGMMWKELVGNLPVLAHLAQQIRIGFHRLA